MCNDVRGTQDMVLSVIDVNVTIPAIHFPCQCIDNRDTLIGFRLQRLEGSFLGGISISGTGCWEIILRLCNDANCKGTHYSRYRLYKVISNWRMCWNLGNLFPVLLSVSKLPWHFNRTGRATRSLNFRVGRHAVEILNFSKSGFVFAFDPTKHLNTFSFCRNVLHQRQQQAGPLRTECSH